MADPTSSRAATETTSSPATAAPTSSTAGPATTAVTAPSRRRRRAARAELTPGHRTDDEQRLDPAYDGVGQRLVRRRVRQVLVAGEEPDEVATLARRLVADGPAQHR